MKLLRVAGGEVLEEETSYKGRLSVGEDMALAISKVTPQDTRTFVCRVEAGSQGVGENRSELRVYSECRAARGRGASRPPLAPDTSGWGLFPEVPETPEIEASSAGIPAHSPSALKVRRDPPRAPCRAGLPSPRSPRGSPGGCAVPKALCAAADRPVREREQLPTRQHHLVQERGAAAGRGEQ